LRSGNVRDAADLPAVGDDVDRLDVQNLASRFGDLRQQTHVNDLVGHRLLDDQLMNVVANAGLGMRGHVWQMNPRRVLQAVSLEVSSHAWKSRA
jgi:hypothetical protein